MRVAKLLFLFILAMPATLQAKWLEASSQHFVIYADETPKSLKMFSDQLERFHHAMAFVTPTNSGVPSPSNRVTIYVVKDDQEVRKLSGPGSSLVYAFYLPRAGGSLAIVPKVQTSTGELDMPMIALLHEYAHHFLLSASSHAWPRWLSEGAAEFFASARFKSDGTVTLGMPALHRAGELFYAPDVTAEQLLDPDKYKGKNRLLGDAFYGKSWLLYHYLTFGPDRKDQFATYISLVNKGKSSGEAARSAFGDLKQLERELERYLTKRTMTSLRFDPTRLHPGPISIRELSAGEAAAMPIRIRSKRGVTEKQAKVLLPEATALAARYADDAAVLTVLAEAAYDVGEDDAAIAAADAALKIDPAQVNAYLQKGYALMRKAETAQDPAATYRAARQTFIALNALENDHPVPLLYFYLSYVSEGKRPNENAVNGLARAVELAPFDMDLRMKLVFQKIRDKQYAQAKSNLEPVAFNPHGGEGAALAQKLLDRIEKADAQEALDPDALLAEMRAAQAKEGASEGEK